MFSHLCRACMVELDQLDPSQTVPLFEQYQDVHLNEICNSMNLPMNENDDLGQNVCKKCARTIKQFHTFHSMYLKSNRKLRRMLHSKSDPAESLVYTSLNIDDPKHTCKRCSATFKTRKLLRQHVSEVHKTDRRNNFTNTESSTNSDNGQPRWKCSYCASRFQTRDLKNIHQKECRTTDVKENEFVDYNNFDTSEFHSGSETNNDFEDDFSLTDKESKYKVDPAGMCDLDASERLKCKKCSESFESLELLRLHDSNQHSEDVDSKLFVSVQIKQEQLDVEMAQLKTEHQENLEYGNSAASTIPQQPGNYRWKCVTCWHAFETRELLRIHRRNHTGTRKITPTLRSGWTCSICDAVLSSRANLQLHKNINHPNAKRERRCNDETKNWGDVGQYDCELCNKTFISKSKIRKHMDVHKNKDRPKRLCTICGLELCSTYNLNNHIRTVHGRERKFHCTLCDRRFSHSHHLKTHMNRHEGIRPFHCDQCVKSFFDKTTLREHIKSVHLNLKAYACKICARRFNRSGNMRAHMLKTHNLGDIGDVNRSLGIGSSINETIEDEVEVDFAQRPFAGNLIEPFRSMIVKTSN